MRTPAVHIRQAQAPDIPLLLNFIRGLAEFGGRPDDFRATAENLRAHLFGPTPKAFAVIAEINGAPVGFSVYYFSFFTFPAQPGIFIEDLFVAPDYRRQGIGGHLLRHLIGIALSENCCRLE